MTPVTIASLTKRFGTLTAVDDVTFSVAAGEVFGLLGPNGAGKTTLIRCLLGYLHATSGEARVLGSDARVPRVRARVGYLPGDLRLEPRLTARQILDFRARLLRRSGRSIASTDIDGLAERLSLPLDRRFGTLSKGNRQKVGVLLCMLGDPDVLALDEPTSGLDPLMQDVVLDMVRERRDAGAAVLLSTHILTEAESIADRVGVLSRGKLAAQSTIHELLDTARQHVTFALATDPPADLLAGIRGLESVRIEGLSIEVVAIGSLQDIIERLAPLGIVRIRTDSGELDTIFHTVTENSR